VDSSQLRVPEVRWPPILFKATPFRVNIQGIRQFTSVCSSSRSAVTVARSVIIIIKREKEGSIYVKALVTVAVFWLVCALSCAYAQGSKEENGGPLSFALEQNYPNPFNPETVIRFSVPATAQTTLTVFNLLGQKVATLFDGVAAPGVVYSVRFDGSALPSGFYLYRLQNGTRVEMKRMVLVK
jgi:hypothetical protein